MISREQLVSDSALAKQLHDRIQSTFPKKGQSPKDRQEWSDACSAYHAQTYCFDIFETEQFKERLRKSDRDHIECAITFLEIDPWFHRSGYIKEKFIRGLKQAQLTSIDQIRLRRIISNVALGPNRREFRDYCKLALVLQTDDFIQELKELPRDTKQASKGKIVYLLQYLANHPATKNG